MPAIRIYKSSLSALIASCLAFAVEPTFGQERDGLEPVRVTKRKSAPATNEPSKKSPAVETSSERITLTSTSKPTGTRVGKIQKGSVVPASTTQSIEPTPSYAPEIITEEPAPMVMDEAWPYPSAYSGASRGYPSFGASGTQIYIDTGIVGSILSRAKVRVEGATFWGKGHSLPTLITTRRPANNTATDGLLNQGTATIPLFGGSEVLDGAAPGIRVSAGLSLDPHDHRGILFRMFRASELDNEYTNVGTSEAVVVRPFFDTVNQASILINHPGNAGTGSPGRRQGTVDASINSDVYGGDLLLRTSIGRDRMRSFDFLVGYQHIRLDESLLISSTSTVQSNSEDLPLGTVALLEDSFLTSNRFHGLALGLDSMTRFGRWSFNSMFKLGMGNVQREIDIEGFNRITVSPGNSVATAEGLLARGSNRGSYRSDRFVVSPEVALTLGYRFTQNLDATLSYTYLGLPSVARAGEQLDPNLASNLSNPPTGPVAPRFTEVNSNYSLHSLSYGLQWRY